MDWPEIKHQNIHRIFSNHSSSLLFIHFTQDAPKEMICQYILQYATSVFLPSSNWRARSFSQKWQILTITAELIAVWSKLSKRKSGREVDHAAGMILYLFINILIYLSCKRWPPLEIHWNYMISWWPHLPFSAGGSDKAHRMTSRSFKCDITLNPADNTCLWLITLFEKKLVTWFL